ncbi:hypothetical protein D917_00960, partial [Trichinella nativa]
MSKVITGGLHSKNGGCIDWGWHGFVAYGCHSFVVVIHAKSMTAVQTLPGHVGKFLGINVALLLYDSRVADVVLQRFLTT